MSDPTGAAGALRRGTEFDAWICSRGVSLTAFAVQVVAWFNLVHSLKDKSLRPAGKVLVALSWLRDPDESDVGPCPEYDALLSRAHVRRQADHDDSDASSVGTFDDNVSFDGSVGTAVTGEAEAKAAGEAAAHAGELEQRRLEQLQLASKLQNQLLLSVRGLEGVIEEDARYVCVPWPINISAL